MNANDKKAVTPKPLRVAIPDGNGGYTYEDAEVFDLRKPRTPGILPVEVGTRRGIVAAPDDEPLRMKATAAAAIELEKALRRSPGKKRS